MPLVEGVADVWAAEDSDYEEEEDKEEEEEEELNRESEQRRERYYNTGYRDGIDIGRTETVQKGFNRGYLRGIKEGFEYGQIRGAINSIKFIHNSSNSSNSSIIEHDLPRTLEARRIVHEHRTATTTRTDDCDENDDDKNDNNHPRLKDLRKENLESLKKRLKEEERVHL
jgi:hypothetical protein